MNFKNSIHQNQYQRPDSGINWILDFLDFLKNPFTYFDPPIRVLTDEEAFSINTKSIQKDFETIIGKW